MSILKAEHISTGYGKKQVLFDVNFEVNQGEFILLVGSNGSGKSTFFRTVYRQLELWNKKGKIIYKNKDIAPCKTHKLINKGLAYIPQKNELFENLSLLENLELSILHLNSKTEIRQRMDKILDQFPGFQKKTKQEVNKLSGGERKLLSLAMALLNKPELLLYDEPLAGLSKDNIFMVLDVLTKVKQNMTFVVIEHRIKELFPIADRVIGFKLGKLYTENLNSLDNIKRFMV